MKSFSLRKTWNINVGRFNTKKCTVVYSFGRGCKTFEAVAANCTEQRFILSAFDRGVVLKKLLFHAKNLLQNENWNCGQKL